VPGIARTIAEALERRSELQHLGEAARRTVVERMDLNTICLPAQVDLVQRMGALGAMGSST
jgi:hypothetical protein